jgi:hypothetical protein
MKGLVSCFLVGVLTMLPYAGDTASAATIAELMRSSCPVAENYEEQAERSSALAYQSQYTLFAKAAAAFYDCSGTLKDHYARDWARYFYLDNLIESARPPSQNAETNDADRQIFLTVKDGAEVLAGSTTFTDVRDAAHKLFSGANQALYTFSVVP